MKYYIDKNTLEVYGYEDTYKNIRENLTDKLELDSENKPYLKYSGEINSEGIYLKDNKYLLDLEIKQKIEELSSERKKKQYAPFTLSNGKIIFGTEKARDNLFKLHVKMKDEGINDRLWLDVDGNPFTITLTEMKEATDMFEVRDTQLYFEEAEAIKTLLSS